MAKAAKTAIKKDGQVQEAKNYSKVIRAVKNEKSGAYSFKANMVLKTKVKEFLKS